SRTSSGSRRTTVMRSIPPPAIAAISAGDNTRPFFSAVAPSRRLCTRIAPVASPTATSPKRIAALPVAAAQHAGDLADDRDGDLGLRHGANMETDRTVDTRQLVLAKTFGGEPFEPLGVGPPRAERTDIEAIRPQCRDQRRIVDLRIVGQRHDCRGAVR